MERNESPICQECSPDELLQIIEKNRRILGCIIIDVRTPDEYHAGCIAGAENIDFSDPSFRERLGRLDKTRIYAVYCRRGIRASQVIRIMRESGFHEVYSLKGGIEQWKAAGLPVEREV
ncbi:MAG: rhodanese-like domain-containing protein [Methanomicrobiales archaeon]|nr:rhodanese-like domain-containing protein [Methanomicrobiales archaeon]